jgi:translation initiation factor 3 subunit L
MVSKALTSAFDAHSFSRPGLLDFISGTLLPVRTIPLYQTQSPTVQRHVYSRLSPNIYDRFHSYENSCELFNYLLSQFFSFIYPKQLTHIADSDGPVKLELPDQWLWDIIDEFIYQFRSFSHYRSHVKTKTDEELSVLSSDGGQVWSCYSVLNVLYSFVQKSNISEHMAAINRGAKQEEIEGIVGEFGVKPLYKMLGYFSIIGLLRVHALLGDFTLALKVTENVELNQKVCPFR